MNHNERFDQLEGLMADMLRRLDQLTANQAQFATSQNRTNDTLDGVINVLKIVDQRFERVEDFLLAADERQQRFEAALLKIDARQQQFEESQQALLTVVQQQTDHLGAAFRALESQDGRLQKLEGTPPATSMRPVR